MPRSRTTTRARTARLTRRGIAFTLVGATGIVGAYALGRPELLTVGVLAVLLPVLAVAFARFRRVNLDVARSFVPDVVSVGQPATVEVAVTNAGPLAVPELRWRDSRPWTVIADPLRRLPALAAPRPGAISGAGAAGSILRYALVPPRRGEFPIGPLSVVLADPFGLAVGEVAVGGTDWLVVTPRIEELPDTGLAILASEGASLLVRRAIGGDDDLSTREYRTGDAMRRVHWRATARHGELMVRQEEPRSHAEARVVLDTRRVGYLDVQQLRARDEPESESFELAVSVAASVALHLARGGFAVDVIETGHEQLAPITPVGPFLGSLATVELSPASGAYPAGSVLHASTGPDTANGLILAILADADGSTIERLCALRPGYGLAIAFVIGWRETPQLEQLSQAGWTCVRVGLTDTAEGAWRAVAELHGARSVR